MWCVKDGAWKMVGDKVGCERWCVTKWCVKDGVSKLVPRLPRKTTVDVQLCHACQVKSRWMSPSATPATQSGTAPRATNPDQARHTVPWVPRLPRKTTVDVSCVPRLPRETKVDVTKCHACHAKCRGAPGDKSGPSAPHSTMSATPATQNDGGCELCATPATWNEGGCHQVPRLPRKVPRRPGRQIRTKRATQYHECHACHAKRQWMWVVCHACHVKRRWMSPSATPATQSAAAPRATNPDQARHTVPWVPRLPRKTTVDVSCVPRLPRETKVDVTKCHACHAKCRGAPGDKSGPSAPHSTMSATPATQNDGGCELCATPATWNEGGCHQVPRLPRKVPRRPGRQIRTKRATQYHECHACHAKRRWMGVCATPATCVCVCVCVCVDKVCVDKECVDKECVD